MGRKKAAAKAEAAPAYELEDRILEVDKAAIHVDTKAVSTGVAIPPVAISYITVPIKGISSLIVHRWTEKAKKQMRAKQQKKAISARGAKNPEEEFNAARYTWTEPDGTVRDGIPCDAIKKAMVNACRLVDGLPMTLAKIIFFVLGERHEGRDLVPITYEELTMREDAVRNQTKVADLRYRPEYSQWQATLKIEFNPRAISPDQLVNLLELSGRWVGILENRPERTGGSNGRYSVVEAIKAREAVA